MSAHMALFPPRCCRLSCGTRNAPTATDAGQVQSCVSRGQRLLRGEAEEAACFRKETLVVNTVCTVVQKKRILSCFFSMAPTLDALFSMRRGRGLCLIVPALMANLGRAPAAVGHTRLRSSDADGLCAGGGSAHDGENALSKAQKLRPPPAIRYVTSCAGE